MLFYSGVKLVSSSHINEDFLPNPPTSGGNARRIDYLGLTLTDTINASDHLPIYASFEVPEIGDMDDDHYVDFDDMALFAIYWQQTNCGECGGADLTCDGNVDWDDLKEFTDNWLECTAPECD